MTNSEQRLIIAILRETDSEDMLKVLLDANYRITQIASTGGFMRRGNSTFLIGVEKDKVPDAIRLIREHSAPTIDPGIKRATVFVLKVDQFEQI